MSEYEFTPTHPDEPPTVETVELQGRPDGAGYDVAATATDTETVDIPEHVSAMPAGQYLEPPREARVVVPEGNPRQTHVYSLSRREIPRVSIGLLSSSLTDQGYDFGAWGGDIAVRGGEPSSTIAYPERMIIQHRVTGELLIHAKAVRSDPRRPHASRDITEAGGIIPAETPIASQPGQRSNWQPPDEIRLEDVPDKPDQLTDAFEALLRGYAVDVEDRLTVPDASATDVVWFKAEAVGYGWTRAPVSSIKLRDSLIGGARVGIVRLTLNDARSATNAMLRNTEAVEVEAARAALYGLGCEITSIKLVEAEVVGLYTGIEINFRRRPDNIIGDGIAKHT